MARTRRDTSAIRRNIGTRPDILTAEAKQSECDGFSFVHKVLSDGLRLSQEVELLKKQNSALLQELDQLRAVVARHVSNCAAGK